MGRRLAAIDGLRGLAILMVTGLLLALAAAGWGWLTMPQDASQQYRPLSLLVLGDSTVTGFGQRVPWTEYLTGRVQNSADNGEGVETALARVAANGYAPKPLLPAPQRPSAAVIGGYDLAVLSYGTSDAIRGLDPLTYGQRLADLIRTVPARRVLVVTPPDVEVPSLLAPGAMRPYAAAAKDAARATGATLLRFEGRLADGVHPDTATGRRLALAVTQALQQVRR